MSRVSAILFIGLLFMGCGRKAPDPLTAESLVGRWRAVTKDDANEGNAKRDARAPSGETIAFRFEFKADHSYEQTVEITGGLTALALPKLAGKHAVRGTWHVVELESDTLTIELPDPADTAAGLPNLRLRVVFQTRDRCIFDADSDEAMVLTRLP